MKKLMLILAALAVSTSVVLTGCNNDNTEKPVEEKTPVEQTDEENKENEEVKENAAFDGTVTEFNNFIEDTVAKYAPRNELDEEVVGTIGGVPVTATAVKYRTLFSQPYLAYGLSEEDVLAMLGDPCRQNAGLIVFAYENGITISEEEIKATVEATLSNLKAQNGEDLESVFASTPYTIHYFCVNNIYSALFNKISDAYLSDVNSEFVQGCLAEAMADEDILRAKHILVQFPEGEGENGEVTDEQKAATLEEANAVLEKVNAMADLSEFDALVAEYNDDPGMVDNTIGYYFSSGEMVPEFENATRELEIGKTSGLVETSYGYHIILRLPIEEESFNGSNKHLSFASGKLLALIDEAVADDEFIPAENYEARVQQFVDEYNASVAAPEEETAEGATEETVEEAPEAEAAE